MTLAGGALPVLLLLTATACGDGSPIPPAPTATPTSSPTQVAEPSPSPGPPIPGPLLDLASQPPALTVLGIDTQDFAEGVPSLAHGDFNADGYDDLLIGAPLADGPDNSREGAGEAYVIFGGADLPDRVDLAAGEHDVVIFGGAPDDGLGYSVLGADVNGDGVDDVLVGAPGTSGTEDPRTDQGQIYVFFGSPELSGTQDIAQGAAPATISGAEGFSRVGHSVAAGDVNGDGIADIIAGAPFAGRHPGTPPGSERTEVGEVYVLFGRAGLSGYFSVVFNQQDYTLGGAQQFGQFGATVASADVNADGVDDIIVGATQADGPNGTPQDAGAVYVFFGAPALAGRRSLTEGSADFAVLGGGERHSLGFPLLAADLNADGTSDIAAGARLAPGPGERTRAGAVYVALGRGDLAGVTDLAAGPAAAAVYGAQASQLLPSSLAAGDVNGDTVPDLIIGSGPANGPDSRASSGLAYVILGGPGLADTDLASGDQYLAVAGVQAGDSLGSSVDVAAVAGRESPQLLLLASAADRPDGSRSDSGAAYVVPLPSTGQ